jgi:Uncharacterized proteins of the AP superfamily
MRKRAILALLLAATACLRPVSKPVALPRFRPTAKVVLISFDGLVADEVERRASRGQFSAAGVKGLIDSGISARVVPVNPTLSAVTHISIATGTTPDHHGIVANIFHMPGLAPNVETSGFDAPIEAETIWEAAHRAGKKVGAITFPGLDGTNARRSADWGLLYTSPISKSRIIKLHRSDFRSEWYPAGWAPQAGTSSYSPLTTATVVWSFVVAGKTVSRDVNLVAIDSTDDGKENYDRIDVEMNSKRVDVDSKRWFSLSEILPDDGSTSLFGSWSKVLRFNPDLSEVTIYWGSVARNEGYPQSYRQMIDSTVGFWPSPPDDDFAKEWLAGRDGVDAETYGEQIERFSDFFTHATLVSAQKMDFDLLLGYQPIIDSAYHQFYLVNDRQLYSTPETRAAGARVRDRAFDAFDRAIAQIRSALPNDATLVTCGDHGFAAGDMRVAVNQLLVDWGFAKREGDKLSVETPWSAFVHGGNFVQFYHFGPRNRAQEDELLKRLRQLRTPDGEVVFEKVEAKGRNANPRSGDIIAYANTRFAMTSYLGEKVFHRAAEYGYHGALNSHPELNTILIAAGPTIKPQRMAAVPQTSIARFISQLLGIDPPRDAQ